jgi:predicted enzyme related to lactoylglutathione lyase
LSAPAPDANAPRPAFSGVEAVLFFTADIDAAAAWYAELFGVRVEYENPRYAYLELPWLKLGFHPADHKCPAGGHSQALYFRVPALETAVRWAEARGAARFRGPMRTDLGEWACLLHDPFGNLFGLHGAQP